MHTPRLLVSTLILEWHGGWGADPPHGANPRVTYHRPSAHTVLQAVLVPEGHSPGGCGRALVLTTEKHAHIGGPTKFQPVLFKGHKSLLCDGKGGPRAARAPSQFLGRLNKPETHTLPLLVNWLFGPWVCVSKRAFTLFLAICINPSGDRARRWCSGQNGAQNVTSWS